MENIMVNLVGYAAAFFGTSFMLPQVVKIWKTKSAGDVSLLMSILFFMNCLMWLIYAYLIGATPLLVTNIIALIIAIFQLFFKIKY